jgi:hypothetical protein
VQRDCRRVAKRAVAAPDGQRGIRSRSRTAAGIDGQCRRSGVTGRIRAKAGAGLRWETGDAQIHCTSAVNVSNGYIVGAARRTVYVQQRGRGGDGKVRIRVDRQCHSGGMHQRAAAPGDGQCEYSRAGAGCGGDGEGGSRRGGHGTSRERASRPSGPRRAARNG